jgi:hypothetical protein
MTYEYVNVGAEPNDGQGDPLRTAYIKINNNFAQLQQVGIDRIGNGSSNVVIPVASGNVYAGVANVSNVLTITSSGIIGLNVSAVGNVVAGSYFIGDGGLISNIGGAASIANGTSNVNIPNINGNIDSVVQGTLTLEVSPALVSVFGDLFVSGNTTLSGNISTNAVSYGNSFMGFAAAGGNGIVNISGTPNVAVFTTTGLTVDNELDVGMIMAQTINTSILSASGNVLGPIPSVSNTFYVAKNGDDGNDGGVNTPFLTIKQACASALTASGNVAIRIASGTYIEQNPVAIPPNTAIMGDNLRTVIVKPSTPSDDLFYMSGGTYVWGLTVRDYLGAAFTYDPNSVTTAYVSPYIQNITSYTTTGTGVRIDGSKAIGTKAMIVGFYTIINRGGIGIDISNSGYSQLVNIYTIGCDIGIRTTTGAFCTLNGSDCSIGNYGLVSTGVGPLQTSGNTIGYSTGGTFVLGGLSNGQPHVNTVMFINDADYSTTSTTTLTIPAASVGVQQTLTVGTGLNYSVGQTAIIASSANQANFMTGTVNSYTSGTGVLVVDVVGVAGRGSGTFSSWRVNLYPLTYYTIDTIVPNTPAAGNATVAIQEVYSANLVPGTSVEFYTRSAIIASAHTFEYVGAGTNPATALPQYGGIPIPANEVVTSDGGVITFTSTDQKGNFRVGKGFTVNQATGTVSGDDFYRSLFATMTPYILALQEIP